MKEKHLAVILILCMVIGVIACVSCANSIMNDKHVLFSTIALGVNAMGFGFNLNTLIDILRK